MAGCGPVSVCLSVQHEWLRHLRACVMSWQWPEHTSGCGWPWHASWHWHCYRFHRDAIMMRGGTACASYAVVVSGEGGGGRVNVCTA